MTKKTYEVEIASTTYRTFQVEADSPEKAQDIAFDEMYEDYEISKTWKQNAEVSFIEEQEKPKDDSELDKLNQDL
jgi:hypothetical protein